MTCTGLFSHTIQNLLTDKITKNHIHKRCGRCGYTEILARSRRQVLFVDQSLMATKQWAADDNRKETLQPLTVNGTINEDFTQAYGYNPYDESLKHQTPKFQGGTK